MTFYVIAPKAKQGKLAARISIEQNGKRMMLVMIYRISQDCLYSNPQPPKQGSKKITTF
jgi:hypothetical protein